jgi:cytoskeletal protein RodZ
MSVDEDILELDADGNFVIPDEKPAAAKIKIENRTDSETATKGNAASAKTVETKPEPKPVLPQEFLESIPAGEYKVYHHGNNLDVVVHLLGANASAISSVSIDNDAILKITLKSTSLSIDVSDHVSDCAAGIAATAYSYADFLSVRFEL